MHEELNQKLSLFIDNELEKSEALDLMHQINQNQELEQKMGRYEAVNQALKSERFLPIDSDFVDRVSQGIESEPTYLIPQVKRDRYKPLKLAAMAASVAAVGILVGQGLKNPALDLQSVLRLTDKNPAMQISSVNDPENPLEHSNLGQEQALILAGSSSLDDNPESTGTEMAPDDKKFYNYLQSHSGNLYASGSNYQAYAQLASFGQE